MATTRLQIDRPVYTQSSLDAAFHLRETEAPPVGERVKQAVRAVKERVGGCEWAEAVLSLFPFIVHLKAYREDWRSCLAGDITAGLTVGIMHIPMGMGFALLAGVSPIYGLYTSFWCVLIYFIIGQSPHMSFGSMAIMSIMLSEATTSHHSNDDVTISNQLGTRVIDPVMSANQTSLLYESLFNSTNGVQANINNSHDDAMDTVAKTMLVTMLTGIMLIAMSILRLSKLVAFMPIPCICGFTTAAAFHIVTSQLKFMLGISIPNHKGMFKLIRLWKEVALELTNTNLCDLTISLCCLMVLFVIKEVINPRFRHKLPVPIPAEMVVVIPVTLISHFMNLNKNYGIAILDETPAGFSAPAIPDITGFQMYLIDAFLIAVLSFIISYSMVSTFSRKHNYDVIEGREMFAYGTCLLIGSFFGSFAAAAAPPRCTVLDTTGAKTQWVHFFTSLSLLLTILLIGPLFEPLPNSCLSAIIVCALIPLFKQSKELIQLWKINKYDFAIWLVTWASVVFLDISIGLAIGVSFSLLTIPIQSCLSKGIVLSTTGHIDLTHPSSKHKLSEEIQGIKIFKFESSLHFASVTQFKDQLFRLTANPRRLPAVTLETNETKNKTKKNMAVETLVKKRKNRISDIYDINPKNTDKKEKKLNCDLKAIILDCSSITYIDMMGVQLIKQLHVDYGHVGVSLVLASASDLMLGKLATSGSGSDENSKRANNMQIYPTIQDAIASLTCVPKATPLTNTTVTRVTCNNNMNGTQPYYISDCTLGEYIKGKNGINEWIIKL